MKTVKDVLIDARKLLKAGWCQGEFHIEIAGYDHYCMIGAISKVTENDLECISLVKTAKAIVRTITGAVHISRWNDTPGRTHEEVLSVMDKAIELA